MEGVFNPFGKSFEKINENDLNILTNVSEGWYVEYKEQKPKPKYVARSISSFANSHGGIYFVGITGNKQTNCADKIDGVKDSQDVIRDAVANNVQPFPYFQIFSIPLQNGRQVLMVVVSEGENPPYIDSSGRIYRRQGAASEPIAESNRQVVDELHRKAENHKRKIEDFRSFDVGFCQAEEDMPHLEMYINTKPFMHFRIKNAFNNEDLRELLNLFNDSYALEESIEGSPLSFQGNIKFHFINTYYNCISLRSLGMFDLAYNGLTVIIDVYGNMKFLMPLPNPDFREEDLKSKYFGILEEYGGSSVDLIKILGARPILGVFMGVMNKYAEYLKKQDYDGNLEVKMRLINCYRTALFISSESFLKHVEEFKPPICMEEEQYFPDKPLTFKFEDLRNKPIMMPVNFFSLVAHALGVPSEIATSSVIEEIQNNPLNK